MFLFFLTAFCTFGNSKVHLIRICPSEDSCILEKMYDRYITENSLNIYGKMLIKLPTPRYTVLYNGVEEQPGFMQLKLSDSFINPDCSGDFEWTANMVNLNDGGNEDLLNNCRPLKDYMTLINEIRKN